jgi:hypothetical protein
VKTWTFLQEKKATKEVEEGELRVQVQPGKVRGDTISKTK